MERRQKVSPSNVLVSQVYQLIIFQPGTKCNFAKLHITPDLFHATNQKNAEFWLLFFWFTGGALREMQKCPTGRCFVASSTSQVAAAGLFNVANFGKTITFLSIFPDVLHFSWFFVGCKMK